MFASLFIALKQRVVKLVKRVQHIVKDWLTPQSLILVLGAAGDLGRSKADLMVENALLRQQLIVLSRQVKRPQITPWDRLMMLWLAGL